MKIVYVVPILSPYMVPMYSALAKCPNTEVHIIVERSNDPNKISSVFQEVEGCKTYLINSKVSKSVYQKNPNGGYAVERKRFFPRGLRKTIGRINPDIVIVCNAMEFIYSMFARKYKLATVVEDTLRAAEKKHWTLKLVKKLLYSTGDFFIPFSNDAIDFLKANGIKKPMIKSSWAMEMEYFESLDTVEKITTKKAELGLSNKKNYILPAMLIPRKGIVELLEAWNEMDKNFIENSHLYILGKGILEEQMKSYCERNDLTNIHFVGLQPYNVVSEYMQCGDCFILPTLEDLCSLSVLEGMAAGLPILTTRYNGARQFVEEGKNGYIFDPEKKESIIDALTKMNASDFQKMSVCSKELAKRYTPQVVMTKLRDDLGKFMG